MPIWRTGSAAKAGSDPASKAAIVARLKMARIMSPPSGIDCGSNPQMFALSRLALKTVLVDLSVLHDDQEILCRILDEPDVLDRIAIDQQEIGQRALFHHAQLAGIGISLAGQSEQLGIRRCCHDQRFG